MSWNWPAIGVAASLFAVVASWFIMDSIAKRRANREWLERTQRRADVEAARRHAEHPRTPGVMVAIAMVSLLGVAATAVAQDCRNHSHSLDCFCRQCWPSPPPVVRIHAPQVDVHIKVDWYRHFNVYEQRDVYIKRPPIVIDRRAVGDGHEIHLDTNEWNGGYHEPSTRPAPACNRPPQRIFPALDLLFGPIR